MGCIEMRVFRYGLKRKTGLIETWDVLKWDFGKDSKETRKRLIETWDVLKYKKKTPHRPQIQD